jgi:uncharacterized membrane protein YbhN (UPF0104 family)
MLSAGTASSLGVGRPARVRLTLSQLRRTRWVLLVQFLGAVLALCVVFSGVDLQALGSILLQSKWYWLIGAITAAAVAQATAGVIWAGLLPSGNGLTRLYLAGAFLRSTFLGQVLPGGASDALRTVEVGKRVGYGPAAAAGLFSGLVTLVAMAAWAAVGVWMVPGTIARIVVIGGAFWLTLLCWMALRVDRLVARFSLSERRGRLARFSVDLAQQVASYRRHLRTLLFVVLVAVAGWGLNLLSLMMFTQSIGSPTAWSLFATSIPISMAISLIPVTINGMGMREGVLVGLLMHGGMALSPALACALFVDAQALPLVFAGGALMAHRSLRRVGFGRAMAVATI